jgi:hypothetical protein
LTTKNILIHVKPFMFAEALTAQATVEIPSTPDAMEYTNVLSLQQLQTLFSKEGVQVKAVAVHANTEEELIAPVTQDGKKILFELSALKFHDISEQHDLPIRSPHDTSEALAVPLHIVVSAEDAEILDAIDLSIKADYRELEECPAWIPMVKTSFTGDKVLMVDVVLDQSDVSTQILLMKSDNTMVEGSGVDFLNLHIGGVANLKDYCCNPIMELAWIMRRETENAHRLRIRTHSIVLKQKLKEPPSKRMKTSQSKIDALLDAHRLVRLTNSF